MTFSLNELEAMAKRATRGAGYPWGLAEEAAKATRWLAATGLDGAHALAALLRQDFASDLTGHTPNAAWRSAEALCPLATGAALSDGAPLLRNGPVTLHNAAAPLLILPFAASAARQLNTNVTLTCGATTAITDGCALTLSGPLPDLADPFDIHLGGTLTTVLPHKSRAAPDPDAWQILTQFAHRTYAPATEESRRLGAGADE